MIISASRRTDIPAFYSKWLLNRLREGYALVPNPRNPKMISKVLLSPENVDCIIFWTKNPEPMADKIQLIESMGYSFYFTFSLTPYGKSIEPMVPSKDRLIEVFKRISGSVGKNRVDWRYDPILTDETHTVKYHLEKFNELCEKLCNYTTRCIISFADEYRHLKNTVKAADVEDVFLLAKGLSEIAKEHNLTIYTCAEPFNLSPYGIEHASCIDIKKIEEITGKKIKAKRDTGQRPACGCAYSADIGMYNSCSHGCVYCYAATNKKILEHNLLLHNPASPSLIGLGG